MNGSENGLDIIFEEVVKTTNDNRIKLIEDTIKYFNDNSIVVNLDHYELYLILDEAISNAMEHGNKWIVDKHVFLQITRRSDEKVEISVKDEGDGFDPNLVPLNVGENKPMVSRGRGIIIIKKFCEVFWNNMGNEIRLLLSIAG
ncbi:MAG: ATP-binding protein [Spirochaetia bacterium]|nr:ATP-binding protein [Spirochaetia bacterium]